KQSVQGLRLSEQIERPASRNDLGGCLFVTKLVGPGHHGAKQQLIVKDNGRGHRRNRITDGEKVAILDRLRDIGADARKRELKIADRHRFGGDNEEPTARRQNRCQLEKRKLRLASSMSVGMVLSD